MNQTEWVEYFETINGRKPTMEEFSRARMAGEFVLVEESASTEGKLPINPKLYSSANARNLRQEIHEKDQELAKQFVELGLSIYNQELNQVVFDKEEAIQKLISLNKENYALKQTYHQLVSTDRNCLSCGAVLHEQDRFCAVCGSDVQVLEAHAKETRKTCTVCATEQAGVNKFCACCGKLFAQGERTWIQENFM